MTTEDPHSKVREHFKWGNSYNENGQPLGYTNWITLKDMEDGHVEAILDMLHTHYGDQTIRDLFLTEWKYRKGASSEQLEYYTKLKGNTASGKEDFNQEDFERVY